MTKKRVLIVSQEMNPYTEISKISALVRSLPQKVQSGGMEVRVLMPKYGTINERRHRLHEVVRLSGMNIIVDDEDYPLIIKVASLPGARMQVYFLDNEEFFKRKFIFNDADEKPFEDNQERMVFFCKGILETVKKFGWPPDVIHCHGWMTSFIPTYLKTVYKNEAIFAESKCVYTAYNDSYEGHFNDKLLELATINGIEREELEIYKKDDKIRLHLGALVHADAVVKGDEELDSDIAEAIGKLDKPVMEYSSDETLPVDNVEFYKSLLEE